MKMFRNLSVLCACLLSTLAFCGEWTLTVEVKASGLVAKAGETEYELKGEAARAIKEPGKYVIRGDISPDGKSIDVKEATKK